MATPPFFLQPVTCNLIPIFYSNISSSISIIGFAGGGVVTDGAVTGAAGVALFSAGAVGTFGVADEAGDAIAGTSEAGTVVTGVVVAGAEDVAGSAALAGIVELAEDSGVATDWAFAESVTVEATGASSAGSVTTGTAGVAEAAVSTGSSTGYSSVSSVTSFFDAAVLLKWLFSLGLWPKR